MSLENEKNEKKKKKTLDDYIVVNKKLYILKSKKSKKHFFFTESIVYILISFASYFSFYLATNKFTNKKELEKNIILLTDYFGIDSIINTFLGIFIVIGIISSLNYVITSSKLNLQYILNRLTHSLIDFVFLMFSSMLGLFAAILEFTSSLNSAPDILKLNKLSWIGIFALSILLFAYVFILTMMKENNDEFLE
ncbi:hypothetical protein OCUAc17_22950 [Acinetobacter pittii]|nr:hypothetical protein OCUAc17_22950 [Acinetobacter pittii]